MKTRPTRAYKFFLLVILCGVSSAIQPSDCGSDSTFELTTSTTITKTENWYMFDPWCNYLVNFTKSDGNLAWYRFNSTPPTLLWTSTGVSQATYTSSTGPYSFTIEIGASPSVEPQFKVVDNTQTTVFSDKIDSSTTPVHYLNMPSPYPTPVSLRVTSDGIFRFQDGVSSPTVRDLWRIVRVTAASGLTSRDPTLSPTNPSAAPTYSPIRSPTKTPTTKPPTTKPPTKQPTTKPPTKRPTGFPSPRPTPAPTRAPTRSPSQPPTSHPTGPPTQVPTRSPSQPPTSHPTGSPSQPPTAHPTGSPVQPPTRSPSQPPTAHPTNSPVQPPTGSPSQPPTAHPTGSPVQPPTRSPSQPPTAHPTKSPVQPPTESPSQSPTARPTGSPVQPPTGSPSQSPTAYPTRSPSQSPTGSPTQPPTTYPTRSPSNSPTKSPSRSPIKPPTRSPSLSPTRPPTRGPTSNPTRYPTQHPTQSPSQPTNNPTTTQHPTQSPSQPTNNPTTTKHPTHNPTHHPTNFPSNSPSRSPTRYPLASPTNAPTTNDNKNSSIIKGLKDLYLWITIGAIGAILLLLITLVFVICRRKRNERLHYVIDVPDDKKKAITPRFGTTTSPHSGSVGEKDVEKHIQASTEMTIPKNLVPVGTDMTSDGEVQEKAEHKESDPILNENAGATVYTTINTTQTQKNLDEEFDPAKQREQEILKPDLPPLSIITPVNIPEREESNSHDKQTNPELQATDQHLAALDV